MERTGSIARPPPARKPSSSSYLASAGAPAGSIYDLPTATAMADLELIPVESRKTLNSLDYNYRGGGGLGPSRSRGGQRDATSADIAIRETEGDETIVVRGMGEDDDKEKSSVADEEAGVTEHDVVVLETEARAKAMYARFTPRKKSIISAIVSFAAVLAPFSSSSFLPAIPRIVVDLNTTATVLNATVAIFLITTAIAPLLWSGYSGVYGRKPIYMVSLPVFALGSMGVALSNSLGSLIAARIVQAAGSSAVLSVGAGTIGDLYPREERGTAMGLFYSGILVGTSLAPALGGVMAEYVSGDGYGSGWRSMQWLLCGIGIAATCLVASIPETAHARGIDVIRAQRIAHQGEVDEKSEKEEIKQKWYQGWVIVWLNPLAPLKLLAHPNICAMSLTSSFVLMSTYTVIVPLGETVAPRYHITNVAILGCFYLAQGGGNYVSAPFAGRYADYVLRKWAKIRNGKYVAEDRLRATVLGISSVLPMSVVVLGWVMQKVGGHGGLAGCVILLFIDGVGLMLVLAPLNTYCVDVMQHRSAEVIAANNCVRYIFCAATSAFALPMIQAVGVGWTNTFAACLVWVGCGLVLTCIKYGESMREWTARRENEAEERDKRQTDSSTPA